MSEDDDWLVTLTPGQEATLMHAGGYPLHPTRRIRRLERKLATLRRRQVAWEQHAISTTDNERQHP